MLFAKFIFGTLCLALFALWIGKEAFVAQEFYHECEKRYNSNAKILRMDICADAKHRAEFEANGQVNCTLLETENKMGPMACMFRKWWGASVPYNLYVFAERNPITVIIACGVILMFSIYRLFASWSDTAKRKEDLRFLDKTLSKVTTLVHQPPRLPSSGSIRNRHTRTAYIEAISDDEEDENHPYVPRAIAYR